ncbi:ABC transporter permease [Haladaptatus pallidirubidus]|uniref:ABC-2 type transporter transmembrane domain-containing protein n=1 Tax=Haladaptatus pallidirubidus TaxID=1008152 RepID=A0AAV3UQX8_9EURY|nr:ABC transporter permease [Haladaptatus pallidirubidus]
MNYIAIALLFSLGFAALSKIVALITQNEDVAILVTNFLALPLLFVSTAFLPETLLPVWMQIVSAFNSATDGVETVRTLMLGWMDLG